MYCRYLIMFCMEFILHEILTYRLNNLHVVLHVIVIYLLGMLVKFGRFSKCQGGGLRNFHDPGGNEDLWGVGKFSGSKGGWPMSDNDIFQGVSDPQ